MKGRDAVLAVRAAARGVVDFTKARILDRRWWQVYYALIDEMDRQDRIASDRDSLHFHLALMAHGNLADEGFSKSQDKAIERYNGILDELYPWNNEDKKTQERTKHDALRDTYKAVVGDPTDPAFAKVLADEVARLKEKVEETEEDVHAMILRRRKAIEKRKTQMAEAQKQETRRRKGRR